MPVGQYYPVHDEPCHRPGQHAGIIADGGGVLLGCIEIERHERRRRDLLGMHRVHGILNEAIGLKLPILVAPYAKASLAAHPAFARSLRALGDWGVTVLPNEVIRHGAAPGQSFNWQPVAEALDCRLESRRGRE